MSRSSLSLPKLPSLPPLFSNLGDDGSIRGPPGGPPGDDKSAGEDEGDEEGNEGAVTSATPLTAIAMWLQGGLDKYNSMLEANPMTTRIVTSGVIGALGDLFSQNLESKGKNKKDIDFRRLFIFTISAAFYFAPVIGAWFSFLNTLSFPGGEGSKALGMLLVDQTAGAVSVIGTYFFFYEIIDHLVPGGNACLAGVNPLSSILTKGSSAVRHTLPSVLVANWKVWPPLNFLNFRYVPPMYQLLVSNLASFFWNIYLAGATANR